MQFDLVSDCWKFIVYLCTVSCIIIFAKTAQKMMHEQWTGCPNVFDIVPYRV